MAHKCKYYASNGKPSQLFDRLYSYYSGKGMSSVKAELAATTSWLATKTDKFKDFAGDLVEDNTNPKTVVVDENGEAAAVYFGESQFFADLPTTDYRSMFSSPVLFHFTAGQPKDVNFKYPFFVSIKNPKIVNVDAGFTKDQMSQATQGLDKSEYDGVVFIHTKENGDQEKLYGVMSTEAIQEIYNDYDKKINTTFSESPNRVRLETIQDKALLSEPVTNFVNGLSHTNNFLTTALKGNDDDLAKMARSVLLVSNKAIPITEGGGKMIGFNDEKGEIVIDTTLQLPRDQFNSMVFVETVRAYTLASAEAKTLVGLENIISTGKLRLPESDYKKYFESSKSFINGLFDNRNFMTYLQETKFPGASESLFDVTMKQIGQQFNFRDSYIPMLQKTMEESMYHRDTNDVELFDEVADEKEEAATEMVKPVAVDVNAPFAHLVTGNELLDTHIKAIFEKLQGLRARVNKKGKPSELAKIRAEILKYQKDLNDIVDKRAVEVLVDIGVSEMDRLKRALNKDIGYKEAWENLNLLEAWKDFSSEFDEEGTDKDMLYNIRQTSLNALELYNKYKAVAWDATVSALTKEGIPTKYIEQLTPERVIHDISTNESLFVGLSFGQHGLEVASDYLIHNRAYKINTDYTAFTQKQKELLDKLGNKDIGFMFNKGEDGKYRPITTYKNELYETITKLSKESKEARINLKPMYDQMKELRAKRDEATGAGAKWEMAALDTQINKLRTEIEDAKTHNTTHNKVNKFMRENFNYKVTAEGIEEFVTFAEEFKEQFYFLNLETGEVDFKEKAYQDALKEHDPHALLKWVEDSTNPYPRYAAKYAVVTPKDQWKNPEYDKFTDAQKEFYDFFVKEYLDAQANVPMDYSFTGYNSDQLLREFAYMDKATVDAFSKIGREVKSFFKDIATVEYNEHDISYDVTGPLSKKKVKKMKFKHVSSFAKGTDGYYKEKEELPAYLQKGLAEGRYKYKDGYLVVSSEGSQNEKMVKKNVDIESDPLVIFNNFIKFGYNYKYKKQVEDILNSVVEMASAIPKQPTSKKGMVNPMGLAFGSKNGSNMEARLNYTIDAFLHGELKESLAPEKGTPGERTFSWAQLIENVNNFTRARQLGLNPISGISNLSMGTINNFMYAGRDEFFNEAELRKAYWFLKDSIASLYNGGTGKIGNAQKIMLLMQQFNMLGNMHEQFHLDKEWLTKLFEHLYMFQKGGEFLNQGAVAIAMMLREKVKDSDGKEVSLWDAFEVKDDKLSYKLGEDTKYAKDDNMFIFAEAMKKVNKEIHGDYDILNPMLAKKKLAGRVAMLFRTWLPQAVKQRVGSRYQDYQLSMLKGRDVYREGRWNTFGRLMNVFANSKKELEANVTWQSKMGNFATFLGAIAANTISSKAGRKMIDKLNLDATDKANMYANVKEAWWLMTIFASTMLLKVMAEAAGDDDDDTKDPTKLSALRWMTNQTSRIENELWFFNSPASFSTIFRDAIPLWSTLQQIQKVGYASQRYIFDNEADTYQRGFRKGDSKLATQLELFFPVSKQVQSVWSMWSQLYTDKYH